MNIDLKPCAPPALDVPVAQPLVPAATYQDRCRRAYEAAGCEWLVVYADREHVANMAFLTGFEPRFEEAILLLTPDDRRILVVGNESESYAVRAELPGLEVVLGQSFSLLGQDRSVAPKLADVLRNAGLRWGDTVGLVGWKYLEGGEWDGDGPGFFAPAFLVDALRDIAGSEGLADATPVMMHEARGLRAVVDADQIAAMEWASARASAAVWRIVTGTQVGDTELGAAGRMGYAGEPLSCHVMMTSASAADGPVVGLSSPTARPLQRGDGIAAAIGYWGGLSCRCGLLTDHDDDFLEVARGYFRGLVAWYGVAGLGARGGDIHDAVVDTLAAGGLKSSLNPGHLVSYDEWSNTPIRPGSETELVSGMPFQVDIIPTPMGPGQALNCEDSVVLADGSLRADLARRHPDVWARITARRQFMADEIGLDLKDEILPLSNVPLCLPPFWLAADKVLALN